MKRLSKFAAIVALVVPSTAIGATIDQSLSFADNSAFSSDFFSTFTQYNGPDTLTGVEVLYNYTSSGTVSADQCLFFQDCEPSVADISLQGAGAFAAINLSDTDSTGITNNTDDVQTGTFALSLSGSVTGFTLADFVGAGNVAGSIEADGGYAAFGIAAGASHSGNVTLRYTTQVAAVPVPASLGLLMIGAAGLGALARRRKTK